MPWLLILCPDAPRGQRTSPPRPRRVPKENECSFRFEAAQIPRYRHFTRRYRHLSQRCSCSIAPMRAWRCAKGALCSGDWVRSVAALGEDEAPPLPPLPPLEPPAELVTLCEVPDAAVPDVVFSSTGLLPHSTCQPRTHRYKERTIISAMQERTHSKVLINLTSSARSMKPEPSAS